MFTLSESSLRGKIFFGDCLWMVVPVEFHHVNGARRWRDTDNGAIESFVLHREHARDHCDPLAFRELHLAGTVDPVSRAMELHGPILPG